MTILPSSPFVTEDDKNSDSQSSKPAQCSVMAATVGQEGKGGLIGAKKEKEGRREGKEEGVGTENRRR